MRHAISNIVAAVSDEVPNTGPPPVARRRRGRKRSRPSVVVVPVGGRGRREVRLSRWRTSTLVLPVPPLRRPDGQPFVLSPTLKARAPGASVAVIVLVPAFARPGALRVLSLVVLPLHQGECGRSNGGTQTGTDDMAGLVSLALGGMKQLVASEGGGGHADNEVDVFA